MEKLPISVIVLTHNDDKIIEEALQSVHGWVEDIFVVDDGSQDRTLDIVRRYTDKIERHCFENYASQRNWALDNLPLKTSWILPLDADQRVTPELKTELFGLFADGKEGGVNGYIAPTKTVFRLFPSAILPTRPGTCRCRRAALVFSARGGRYPGVSRGHRTPAAPRPTARSHAVTPLLSPGWHDPASFAFPQQCVRR